MPKKVKLIESGMFFRKLPFCRFVKQVIQDMPEPDVHVSSDAMIEVQQVTEAYLETLMDHSKLAVAHGNRETLRNDDIDLVREITKRDHRVVVEADEEEEEGEDRPSRVRPRRVEDGDTVTKKQRKVLEGNEGAISK